MKLKIIFLLLLILIPLVSSMGFNNKNLPKIQIPQTPIHSNLCSCTINASNLTNLVPYTGANNDVDLGVNSLTTSTQLIGDAFTDYSTLNFFHFDGSEWQFQQPLNVYSDILQSGINVCLSNGTNCLSGTNDYYNITYSYNRSQIDTNLSLRMLITDQRYNETYTSDEVWINKNSSNTFIFNETKLENLIPSLLTYYFWDINDSINATYKIMNLTRNPSITQYNVSSLTNDQVIVYRLNRNSNLTNLNGVLHLHTTALKTAGIQDLQIKGRLSKLMQNGTIKVLAITDTTPFLVTGVSTLITLTGTVISEQFNISDMLLWQLEAVVTGLGTAPSVSITVGGDTNNGLDVPITLTSLTLSETDPIWTFMRSNYYNTTFSYNQTQIDTNLSLRYLNSNPSNYINYTNLSNFGNNNINGSANISTTKQVGIGGNVSISLRPLAITANSFDDILELKSSGGLPKWHLNLASNDLDFVETGVATGRLHLKTGGKIGIGTLTPTRTLDVRGTANFSGIIFINNITDISKQTVSNFNISANSTTVQGIKLYVSVVPAVCNDASGTNGSFWRNSTGVVLCNSTGQWRIL